MNRNTSDGVQQEYNNAPPKLPPPPPPPPLRLPLTKNEASPHIRMFKINKELCPWAANASEEFREACQKWQIYLHEEPLWNHTYIESLLQEGPTCGLVAASILLNKAISPEDILKVAKASGYSNKGEMFSAKNMHNLLNEITDSLNCKKYEFEYCKDLLTADRVIDSLVKGSMMLVPYDCDKNHSPCLKKGHSAHWAIVNGILTRKISKKSQEMYDLDNTYVTAKHGKSLHLAVWKLRALEESNGNLCEVSKERIEEGSYVLPEGGLFCDNGLNKQFILIHSN